MKYSLDNIIGYGKYKGLNIKELIDQDIDYFVYCLSEHPDFILEYDTIIYFIHNYHKILLNGGRHISQEYLTSLLCPEDFDNKGKQYLSYSENEKKALIYKEIDRLVKKKKIN